MRTSSDSFSLTVVDGRVVWPCRCGDVHEGDYGAVDYARHNCFHDEPLAEIGEGHYCCPSCGKDFWIEGA